MDHPRQLDNCIYEIGELEYVIFEPGTQSYKRSKQGLLLNLF